MSIVAPNTPRTAWIRDSGEVIRTTTDVLVDESGNFFVDESGNNLLDSVSTDGYSPETSWNDESTGAVMWAEAHEPLSGTYSRTTAQGDTRTTAQGNTRTLYASSVNRSLPHTWNDEDNENTMWANAFEAMMTIYTRTTAQGATRTTAQGDTRTAQSSDANRQPLTTWSEDEY